MTTGKKIQLLRNFSCLSSAVGAALIYFDCCHFVLPAVLLGTVLPLLYLFIPVKKKLQQKTLIALFVAIAAASILIPVRYAVSTALIIILALLVAGALHQLCSGRDLDRSAKLLTGFVALAAVALLAAVFYNFSRINVYSDMRIFAIAFAAVFISLATADPAPAIRSIKS